MKQFIPRFFVTLMCMVTVISILAVTSYAVSSEPVEIIHGKDVVVGFFYPGRSTSNKAINLEYDKEAYTSSLVTNTDMNINDVDNTYYKVYLGLDNLIKDAPCVALGVSYSSSVDVEISIQTDAHMSDTETHKLNNTVSKLIFDLSDIGYSNSELYKYLRIGTGIDNGEILPKGTKLSVEYIAFFADIDAAKAYVYEKPVDTAPIYLEDNHIKSVSFNVMTAGHTLSPSARAPYMARTILEYEPDIIGLQEANATWYSELAHLFGEEYGSIVKWRTTTDSESTPIFYKKDKFELLDSGYFWLSDTPDVQSLGWGANFHRICCWVKLKIKTTGKEFYYFNTHWDFSEAPQLGSAKLFYDKIKNKCQDLPVILTADFNMTWNSEGYAMLRSFLTESNHERNPQHTYNNLNDGANSILIDYLFYTADNIISQNYTVIKDRIITDDYNYHLSDHYGIFNDLYFLGTPNEYTLSFKNELTQTLIPDITALENVTTNLPRGEPVLGKRFIGWSADGGKTLVNDCFTAYADTVFFAYYEDAENYTVTYLTGERVYKSEIVAAGSAYKIITDTTDIIPEPGYYFYGWVNSDGKKLEGTIEQVIEDIILYASFKEIVPLKDYYVLTPVDLTPSTNGFTLSVVEESDTDTSYFRYTVTTDGTSHDNTRAYLKPSSETFFPLQFSLHDYKYLKIGYRSNITTTAKMGMNLWSVGSRIYGPDVTVKYNNSWQTHVYDLSVLNSGEAGATFENSCDGPLKNLFIKPYAASNTVMKSGEYFDIQYIALFDNLKEAENFKYSYTFSYDTLGGKDGPASADVFPGTELTISDIIPSKKDFNFLGWTDNAQSSEVKYRAGDKITVDNADVTLYAVWDT
ncbi:MAG: InlB B-repeat-containing protein, partial [Clostridia bacterium]|nr:InlB B-repeat-containing protein [Clostridia bacterium]